MKIVKTICGLGIGAVIMFMGGVFSSLLILLIGLLVMAWFGFSAITDTKTNYDVSGMTKQEIMKKTVESTPGDGLYIRPDEDGMGIDFDLGLSLSNREPFQRRK